MKTIDYDSSFGTIQFPDGFVEKLNGKTIEEQMQFFRIAMTDTYSQSSYGEVTNERILKNTYSLAYSRCKGIIVKDGIIVGVLITDFTDREVPRLPYHAVTTYYASDNDGAGYKERRDRVQLICV